MTTHAPIDIVTYRDEYAPAFDRLNRAWLVSGNFLEAADEVYLAAPRARIIEPGGEIFFALHDDAVIGTAAAIPHGAGVYELGKLAVDPSSQGRGLGRMLTNAVIEYARTHNARCVVLTSSTRLTVALALYRSLGFQERPCPPGFGYETADVYMELALG